MNLYNYAALLSVIWVFSLAFYLIARNPEERMVWIFSRYLFLSAVGLFSEYLCGNATSAQVADIVIRSGMSAWSFSYAVFLHFALIFSEKYELLKKKMIYGLLYLPPAVFAYLFIFTNFMIGGVEKKYQGYIPLFQSPLASYVVQIVVCYFGGIYLIFKFSFSSKNPVVVKRGRLFALAFLLAVMVALAIGIIPSIFFGYWIELPPYNAFWMAVACSITFYAMQKYSLFAISPARAVNAILSATSGSIIALDHKGRVSFINQSAARMFSTNVETGMARDLAEIIERKDAEVVIEQLVFKGQPIKDYRASIKTDSGKKEVVITGVVLFDRLGTRIGAVLDLQDISELVKVKDQLQSHVSELERMNKFMTGRELNMAELKKEVNRLLARLGEAKKYDG